MKPINLKIKGLNSFIDEQEIDFLKLTDRGLFGIFGPTGSGKTTILDGITLALYGEVSRKSTNYINTNCDKLNIHYEFQISGRESKRYAIDREFKRDKKTGNPTSGKCKIVDITTGEPLILADKIKEVTSKCEEIIGLSLEDFTRTVVLPQGKFSDFIKLGGKNRREMLERLFNLQQYGDTLSYKLSREINNKKDEFNVLIGEMKGYEGINIDNLKSKQDELGVINESLTKECDEFEKIENLFTEGKEIWNLQAELLEYKNTEDLLIEKEDDIKYKSHKVKVAQSANKVIPYINSYEKTLKDLENSKVEEDKVKELVEKLKSEKLAKEAEFKLLQQKKEDEMPKLKIQELKANDALKEKIDLENLEGEIEKLLQHKKNLEYENNNISELQKKIENDSRIISANMKEIDRSLDSMNIESGLKEKVQQGVLVTEKFNELDNRINGTSIKIKNITDNLATENSNRDKLNLMFKRKEAELHENQLKLELLIKSSPGEQSDLLDLQGKLSESTTKWNKYNEASEEIDQNSKLIFKQQQELNANLELEKKMSESIINLKQRKKEVDVIILAHKLREELRDGESCPVCGSLHHDRSRTKDFELDSTLELEAEISNKENDLKKIQGNIVILNTKINSFEDRNKSLKMEINSLGEGFKNCKPNELKEKLNLLLSNMEKYNQDKKSLETKVNSLKEDVFNIHSELTKTNTILEEGIKQLEILKSENAEYNKSFNLTREMLKSLISETNVTDFKERSKEITKIEKERENFINKMKQLRTIEENSIKEKDQLQKKIIALTERLVKGSSIIDEKENIIKEKKASIFSKVGEIDDINGLIISITTNINELEVSYKKCKIEKEEADKSYTVNYENLLEIGGKIRELINRERDEKKILLDILIQENFENTTYVKESYMSNGEIETLLKDIDIYNSSVLKVKGAIENLKSKLKNRELTEEQWINIQLQKNEKEKLIKEINEEKIKKVEEISLIEKKINKLDKLIYKKEKLDHKLAVLSDLEKLFKGKKFVEFVAVNRLKYISNEASKRLKEITNGNYGLEIDENSKFIIRDYKNGGVERDASTLSGGETFLASLSLALALSAEIQLKGTAPLELFFLDEGFGTLDDELLEVVMSSLEKIHNDKLKIGIISHVESIKNRVPVKLILSPAEAGMGGSKVKIERS